ncbi:MAG TPA: outer membrane protein assembly factor BamD [Phycisphaerae bacterium]|nr:outer membrane protein assembly factor BamD [Phycisphaerae bacterium]
MKHGCFAPLLILLASATARGDDKAKPTYHERLEFDAAKGQWIEIAPPIPGTEDGDLALARSLLAQCEYKDARKAFEHWFETYPESTLRPEALFYAAETEVSAEDAKPKSGDLMQAHRWLEEILDGWPGTNIADRALRKELIIAEMVLFKGRKQKVWKVLWLSADEETLTILDRIIDERARETPIAEQALRLKADYYYINGNFEEAETAYARLMRDFPRGRYHKFAMLRAGESALARFPGVEFDDADLLEAEVYLKDFSQKYPQDAGAQQVPQTLARVSDQRAEKEYRVAQYYERTKQIDAAAYYYRLVEKDWSATTWAFEARNRLIAMGAMEPPPEPMEPAPEEATTTPPTQPPGE